MQKTLPPVATLLLHLSITLLMSRALCSSINQTHKGVHLSDSSSPSTVSVIYVVPIISAVEMKARELCEGEA